MLAGIDAAGWVDAYPLIYDAAARKSRKRRQRRRESERARRQSAEAVAARTAKLAAAQERIETRFAEVRRNPLATATLWRFTEFYARAGDRDAKLLWRAKCARLFAERRREQRASLRARIEARLRGYYRPAGPVGGNPAYWRPAITYSGLVSDEHPILKLFAAKLRRAHALLVGNTKAVATGTDSKLLALDAAYVEANKAMRGVLRVEIDRVFAGGFVELVDAVTGCGVPPPNLVVGHFDAAGRLHHPHLLWLLHESVAFTDAGRAAPQGLWKAVLAGLTLELLPIGADPDGGANAMRTKNPLSPQWHRAVLTEAPYSLAPDPREGAPGFAALAPHLDLDGVHARLRVASEARQGRRVIVADHPDPATAAGSNPVFRHLRDFAYGRVCWHREHGSEGEFGAELAAEALRIAPGGRRAEQAARAVADRVAGWTWTHYRTGPARPRCASPEERRERLSAGGRAGARAASEAKRSGTHAAVAEAIQRLSVAGCRPTQAAVAVAIGRSERTVRRHWIAALAAAAEAAIRPRIDKKGPLPLAPPAPAVETVPEIPEVHGPLERRSPFNGGCEAESGRWTLGDLGDGWRRPSCQPGPGLRHQLPSNHDGAEGAQGRSRLRPAEGGGQPPSCRVTRAPPKRSEQPGLVEQHPE